MRATARAGRPRFSLFVAAGAAAAVAVSGCAAGQVAQTIEQTSVVDGSAFQAGAIDLRDVGVRAPTAASLPKGGVAYLEGVVINSGSAKDELVSVSTPAASSVSFYPDGVTAVVGLVPAASASGSASGSATASGTTSGAAPTDSAAPTSSAGATAPTSTSASPSTSASSSAARVTPLSSIPIEVNQAVRVGYDNSQVQIVLVGLATDLAPAQTLEITFTFAKAGPVTARIAVKLVVDSTRSTPTVDTKKAGG